jgi:peptide chain release factor subunit 1
MIDPWKLFCLGMADNTTAEDNAIEQWKIRKLIQSLNAMKGNGTSMISLIIPPKDQISRINKMLTDEMGTASNIKSRVNKQSVLSAITSTQQRLKMYTRTPERGLVVYCGTCLTEDGKEKKVTIDYEPWKPINTSLYMCDSKFHTDELNYLLESEDRFGFIIMDGSSTLYGVVQGSSRDILHKFTVELPKKHGRGGQSSVRFGRLRMEKRHNYLRKVAELSTQFFITNDRPNVKGLILAGSAEFKTELSQSDLFDPRLLAVVLKIVDISYGGENGFNQAIELSGETLREVKFVQEKQLIGKYFEEVATDSGRVCFGLEDSMTALDMGAVELLIVYENLDLSRYVIRNPHTSTETVHFLTPFQEKDEKYFKDAVTNVELEVVEKLPITEWLVNNYKKFGAKLEFVTNKSQEGAQFQRGFGGIGGLLRYKVEFQDYDVVNDEELDAFM